MKEFTLPPQLSRKSKIGQKYIPQLLKPLYLSYLSDPVISGFEVGFVFLFILAEFLKNHSKSQKIHKTENLILLDST